MTDRLDGDRLLTLLIRYYGGERGLWSVVRVPSVEEEDARRGHREMERLKKERTAHRNRLRRLLVMKGIRLEPGSDFPKRLETRSLWDARPLPPELKGEYSRLKMVEEQLRLLEKTRVQRLEQAQAKSLRRVAQLMRLRAIGPSSAWVLVQEFFGWRRFRHRRELASLAGLTGTPL